MVGGQLAADGNACQKISVETVHQVLHLNYFLVGQREVEGSRISKSPGFHGVKSDAVIVGEFLEIQVQAKNADGAGNGVRLGKDAVGRALDIYCCAMAGAESSRLEKVMSLKLPTVSDPIWVASLWENSNYR